MTFDPLDPMDNGESAAGYAAVMGTVRGDKFDRVRAEYLAAHSEVAQVDDAVRLANVQAQRERILNAKTVTPDLPDSVACALVGLSFVPGYPANVREWERELSRRYWVNTDNPEPLVGQLRRNPDNEYDPNAVEVHFGGSMLGHLPRNVARKIAPEMDDRIGWAVTLTGVRTHPDNPDSPGVDVRLSRVAALSGAASVADAIRESVEDMEWCEVDWEIRTRGLERPADRAEMNEALIRVFMAEREAMLRPVVPEFPVPRYLGEGEWSDGS